MIKALADKGVITYIIDITEIDMLIPFVPIIQAVAAVIRQRDQMRRNIIIFDSVIKHCLNAVSFSQQRCYFADRITGAVSDEK